MKRVILTSLVSLATFTSVMSADIRPAEARGNLLVNGTRSAYDSAQEGDFTGIFVGLFFVAAGVASCMPKS